MLKHKQYKKWFGKIKGKYALMVFRRGKYDRWVIETIAYDEKRKEEIMNRYFMGYEDSLLIYKQKSEYTTKFSRAKRHYIKMGYTNQISFYGSFKNKAGEKLIKRVEILSDNKFEKDITQKLYNLFYKHPQKEQLTLFIYKSLDQILTKVKILE